jgi:hypothetical protein
LEIWSTSFYVLKLEVLYMVEGLRTFRQGKSP